MNAEQRQILAEAEARGHVDRAKVERIMANAQDHQENDWELAKAFASRLETAVDRLVKCQEDAEEAEYEAARNAGRPNMGDWPNAPAASTGHYERIFGHPQGSEFRSFSDFMSAVDAGLADSRLAQPRALAGSLGSTGGFAVPDQFVRGIMDAAIEDALVLPRARVVPMTGDTAKVAGWADTSHASNLYGGFTGQWLAEGATATRQYPALRMIELTSKKLALFTKASSELVADAPGFETDLEKAMSKVITFYSDEAFVSGTGAGQPLGVLNDPALIPVTSTAGAGKIDGVDLFNMLARLHPGCYKNAVWVASSEAIGYIWTLEDTAGTNMFKPEETRAGGRLLGLPVMVSEHASQVGTLGDIMLVDWSQYLVGLRKDVVMERSAAPSWASDELDYRVVLRVDGQGTWQSAVTPKNGGDTLSWCVAIGSTRS